MVKKKYIASEKTFNSKYFTLNVQLLFQLVKNKSI